jgi:hypothetical protein
MMKAMPTIVDSEPPWRIFDDGPEAFKLFALLDLL